MSLKDKILYEKKVYEFEKECEDDFGKYNWYFRINKLFTLGGIYYEIKTSDLYVSRKTLKECLNVAIEHLERKNPRYYRLKEDIAKRYDKNVNIIQYTGDGESFEKVNNFCNRKLFMRNDREEIRISDDTIIHLDAGDYVIKTKDDKIIICNEKNRTFKEEENINE